MRTNIEMKKTKDGKMQLVLTEEISADKKFLSNLFSTWAKSTSDKMIFQLKLSEVKEEKVSEDDERIN